VTKVLCHPNVERKIEVEHQVTLQQVREAVAFRAIERCKWHDHPQFGRRLFAWGRTEAAVPLLVILKPVEGQEGTWVCKTARRTDR
jgi:hypothetical protein